MINQWNTIGIQLDSGAAYFKDTAQLKGCNDTRKCWKVPMLACPLRLELHRNAIGLDPLEYITIWLFNIAMENHNF